MRFLGSEERKCDISDRFSPFLKAKPTEPELVTTWHLIKIQFSLVSAVSSSNSLVFGVKVATQIGDRRNQIR